MKLVIFDLDQTLVEIHPVHEEAVRRSFQIVFGTTASLKDTDSAGRSLTESFAAIAAARGIPPAVFAARSRELLSVFEREFADILPADARQHILPGARELLKALSATDNLVVLYTGNSPITGGRILETTGLGRYFRLCFYGTEFNARADMITRAAARAREITGRDFTGKDVVVVGDSLRDVQTGRSLGALTIALGTGPYSTEELSRQRPDYVFPDLRDYRSVLRAIQAAPAAPR
jgi:phosphoglycolate phosphatase